MDNDLKLLDVINDPDALDQFLDFSAANCDPQQNSIEATTGDFFNFENGQILKSSTEDSNDIQWSYAASGLLSASASDGFFDNSLLSSATQNSHVPLPTLTPKYGAVSQIQNLPAGVLPINSSGNYSSQNVIQLQQPRSIPNQLSGAIVADNALQRAPSVNNVLTNFAVANSASNNSVILPNTVGASSSSSGGHMLMSVQPQTVVQNGAVRIQYVQLRNQQQSALAQLPTNSLNPVQLQQQGLQVSHGVQGGINLQGARILIQTGNQSVSGARTGQQINLQQVQVGASNLVGFTQGTGLQQGNILQQGTVVQHGAVLQQGTALPSGSSLPQGVRLQQAQLPAVVGRTNPVPMTGQVVDSNLNLSSGRQVVLQRAPGQNVVFQTLSQQQQHGVTLQQQPMVSSQDGKLPDGLVVQIAGQMYRFEQSHQATGGVAVPVKQGAIYPQSHGGEFGEGGGVAHDPVKMLQQNVQLQQMLIGNQINVLQLLQQQQQRQQQTTANSLDASMTKNFVMVGQQFAASQVATHTGNSSMMVVAPHPASGGVVASPVEVTGVSSGLGSAPVRPAISAPALRPSLEKTVFDPSSQGAARILPAAKTVSTSLAATPIPLSGLQFIQPKPSPASVAVLRGATSGVSSQPVNVLRPGGCASVQQLNARLPSSLATVQSGVPSAAPLLAVNQLTLKSGTLQGPQNVQPVAGTNEAVAPTGQSQTVTTTVQLSADQQNLLAKIQSQMKTLLDLPKRNPDQEKYLQMLIGGQQRIISQGVAQYLQQQKISSSASSSGVTGSQAMAPASRPALSMGASVHTSNPCPMSSGGILTTGGTSVTSALSTVTSTSSASEQLSLPSSLQNSGAPVKAEDLFQAFPYLKEKLEAQLAKMPPEQRQWFARNQSVVFAKLQHHHRLLQERDKLQQQQLQQQQQPPTQLTSHQQNSAFVGAPPPPESTATRVIRSLHLTRAQKFHLYLQKDQKRATHPESSKPFENFKDVIRGLVPYHVFQTREPPDKDVAAVEEAFEEKSRELLERKDFMLRKYRHLLWEESMRPQLTSEMVLLERAFHSDEKALLLEEKRQAEDDPDSFVPRPVLKRLKVDDDVKKEEEACKGEDVIGEDDTRIDFGSPDDDFVKAVKTEHSAAPSSPTNTGSKCPPFCTSVRRSSSVECHKSLQIKLEKLDDTELDTSKRWQVTRDQNERSLSLHISARNVARPNADGDEVSANETRRVDSDDWFARSAAAEVPASSAASLYSSFTEDDVAVASLLNTEQLTSCSFATGGKKVASPCAATNEDLVERNPRFDLDNGVGALGESMNSNGDDAFFEEDVDQEMSFDTGTTTNEKEDAELMQGTIDSLMADLTQFNRDLSGSSWTACESKSDTLNGSLRRTGNPDASAKYDSPAQDSTSSTQDDCESTSLQHEIQCAINSIIRLQQPWTDDVGVSTEMQANVERTDDDDDSLDAAVNSILL